MQRNITVQRSTPYKRKAHKQTKYQLISSCTTSGKMLTVHKSIILWPDVLCSINKFDEAVLNHNPPG